MRFSRVPLDDAEGAILAHSMTVAGGVIKKGRTLGRDEIARLRAADVREVVAARLDPGDVAEDEAALRVATAALGPGTTRAAPFTGRANLFAAEAGLAVVRREAIERLNSIDEGMTIATIPPFEHVAAGQMLATIKVITFALPESIVKAAEDVARQAGGLVEVRPFRSATAGLVMTRMAATKPSVLEKRRRAIESRLHQLGSRLGSVEIVEHHEAAVAGAIRRAVAEGADPVIVFAASAIVDRGDVIPAALVEAGGSIIRLGMPVDPGNLMLLGRLGDADVIGAPSCAGSPKLNGFDWILERRLAGVEVGLRDVAAMGVGGLLKEIATRPQPRAGDDDTPGAKVARSDATKPTRRAPAIGVVVLAAGRSTRFGTANKLLADLNGEPLIRHTVAQALASRGRPVVVVTGHQADEVEAALTGLDVRVVRNPAFANGLSTSLKAGLAALPGRIDGAIILLGDMPGIRPSHLDRLISGFAPKEGRSIVVPVHNGKRGNPVLFAAEFLAEISDIEGDAGAKQLIGRNADEVAEVDLGTDAIFVDVDTPAALSAFKGRPA